MWVEQCNMETDIQNLLMHWAFQPTVNPRWPRPDPPLSTDTRTTTYFSGKEIHYLCH